jgi:hypothetical protein
MFLLSRTKRVRSTSVGTVQAVFLRSSADEWTLKPSPPSEIRLGEAALLEDDLSGGHVDAEEERGAEIAVRAVEHIADTDGVAVVNLDLVVEPQLLNARVLAVARQLQRPAARLVGR